MKPIADITRRGLEIVDVDHDSPGLLDEYSPIFRRFGTAGGSFEEFCPQTEA
jgi:hypothetical protein